ncbi:MAG TPA: carbamoyltransferase HypF [Bacteroidota bacterium]|nr:carbamoyltransferase HypF [Bacteroidota bacterium]
MIRRSHIVIRGAVQGVGFRPFIYRLAASLGLTGWVLNSSRGVYIEAEGEENSLTEFLIRIGKEKPALASIQSCEAVSLDPAGYSKFEIRASEADDEPQALILPDIAVCPDCLREMTDPADRRFGYPFINCTNCGPRFSIIERLPYDRASTTMRHFPMCDACRKEYEDPADRRFHAEPIACPDCGPEISLADGSGKQIAAAADAIVSVCDLLRAGKIVAVKGVGGFHLLADAGNREAVQRLRVRKHREEKPFAVLFPGIGQVREVCDVQPLEERILLSPESPIVLLTRRWDAGMLAVAEDVAPGNPALGVLLPSNPLHHLITRGIGRPVVATSGNLSDEPICIDNGEALRRLNGIADYFLLHDRPIRRHVDDSIVRIVLGREYILRRARGYAPLPIRLNVPAGKTILAVGAHLKNTVAVAAGENVFLSQHIGDLESNQAFDAFTAVITDLAGMYRLSPGTVVMDRHPDYLSTKYALEMPVQHETVQHHYAHVAACMADNRIDGRLLGISWDGSGYGTDGTVWGGEFFAVEDDSWRRIASLRPFPLLGGDQAAKEPRRSALGVLSELLGDSLFERTDLAPVRACTGEERRNFAVLLKEKRHTIPCSSAGRLFDAVASLTGLRQFTKYEGQAAMELEFSAGDPAAEVPYRCPISPGADGLLIVDWREMVNGILADLSAGISTGRISARFHATLADSIVAVARAVGLERVVLTGGCFQNRRLLEQSVHRLREEKFQPYWHQRVPPNDGGIALGQVYAAVRMQRSGFTPENTLAQAVRSSI